MKKTASRLMGSINDPPRAGRHKLATSSSGVSQVNHSVREPRKNLLPRNVFFKTDFNIFQMKQIDAQIGKTSQHLYKVRHIIMNITYNIILNF